jgi:drug/metabolite transporter (DMT)-like permease
MPTPLPLAIVIVSGIVYHLAQRSSGPVRPWPMLTVAYGAAFAVAVACTLATSDVRTFGFGRGARTAGLLIGLAAFGIEAGFFYIYRSGWPLASASVIAGATTTAILAVVGVIVYREPITGARVAGLFLATAGAALIARG